MSKKVIWIFEKAKKEQSERLLTEMSRVAEEFADLHEIDPKYLHIYLAKLHIRLAEEQKEVA